MKVIILIFISLLANLGFGQRTFDDLKQDIAFYGDVVMNAAATEHRMRANDELLKAVDAFLQKPSSFSEDVQDLPWISVVQDNAETFRLLTWQLNVGDSSYVSFGRLQLNSNETIELNENKNVLEPQYRELDVRNWIGARYYDLKEFDYKGMPAYVLFGYNGYSKWNRQKIAEILYFDQGQPKFGLPVFAKESENADRYGAYRLLLTYSSDSRVSLNFDEKLNMIVHDHLVPIQGRFQSQGESFIGDGSYEGYRSNQQGIWIYTSKLFEEASQEPLESGEDHSDKRKVDLFGKKRE